MVGPVRFAWLRRCSSAASVHRLCPDYNGGYPESSSEFQRHLHNWRAFTWSQSRQMTPSSTLCHQIPPPPKAQLLDGAIKHADIRLDSVHHAASGTRKVTARFYVPDSRVRASLNVKNRSRRLHYKLSVAAEGWRCPHPSVAAGARRTLCPAPPAQLERHGKFQPPTPPCCPSAEPNVGVARHRRVGWASPLHHIAPQLV